MNPTVVAYFECKKLEPKDQHTVTELFKAMVHSDLSLSEARNYYRQLRGELLDAIQELDDDSFRRFLHDLALCLKASKEEGKKRMKQFVPRGEKRLSSKELAEYATQLSAQIHQANDVNKNKLKRLGARLSASRDPYDALAHLTRFYSLSGVPEDMIDHLVDQLGELELSSFKDLYALGLKFYEAKLEGWEAPNDNT